MNLKRCANGHFYDVDKYPECPHCMGGSGVDESMSSTRAYDEHTMPYADSGLEQGSILGNTVAYTDISGVAYGEIPAQDSMRETRKGNLEDYIKGLSESADVNDRVEEADNKTIRHSSIEANCEPVVGWLVCLSGENLGKSYILKSGRNFIGRGNDMDVVLSGDRSISRDKHAIILYEPRRRQFMVQPGTSKELFYLNDEVVLDTCELKAFDKLLIGETTLYFVPLCGESFAWEDLKDE